MHPGGDAFDSERPLEEVLPVHVVEEDVFAPIPAAHHMVHRTWIFHPQLTWHETIPRAIRPGSSTPKSKSTNHVMADPFSFSGLRYASGPIVGLGPRQRVSPLDTSPARARHNAVAPFPNAERNQL
jgi:hypothetical protein